MINNTGTFVNLFLHASRENTFNKKFIRNSFRSGAGKTTTLTWNKERDSNGDFDIVRVFLQNVSRTIRRAIEASLNKRAAKFIPEIIQSGNYRIRIKFGTDTELSGSIISINRYR